MVLEVFSGAQALENHRANARSAWPIRNRDANRLRPTAQPWYAPTFTIDPGDRIFTIGSCFARNIEDHLADLGFDVPTRPVLYDLPADYTDTFSPHAIRDGFRRALEPDPARPDDFGLYQVGDDAWFDPFANASRPAPLEVVTGRRAQLMRIRNQIGDCRVIILTLGVVEVWYDEELGEFLNRVPPINFVRRHPDRFSLHILDYNEITRALDEIHELLSHDGHPGFRILITVSPVPLVTTFTDRDVLVANMYSKSVLRAATEQFARAHANVDYFPSFESVMLSPRDVTWEEDNRHVTPTLIGANVSRMIRAYAPELAPPDFEQYFQAGQAGLRDKAYADAERAFVQALALDPDAVGANHGLGVALLKLGKFGRAEEALKKAIELLPGKPSAESRFHLGLLYFHNGEAERAVEHYQASARLQPHWSATRFHLAEALEALDRLAEAEAEMQTSVEISPDYAHVQFRLGRLQMKRRRFAQAADSFRRAIALPDVDPRAHDLLAEASAKAAAAEDGRRS